MTIHLHLVSRLRMCGGFSSIPPYISTASCLRAGITLLSINFYLIMVPHLNNGSHKMHDGWKALWLNVGTWISCSEVLPHYRCARLPIIDNCLISNVISEQREAFRVTLGRVITDKTRSGEKHIPLRLCSTYRSWIWQSSPYGCIRICLDQVLKTPSFDFIW